MDTEKRKETTAKGKRGDDSQSVFICKKESRLLWMDERCFLRRDMGKEVAVAPK